ncbi:IS3 family transposase [Nocardiopsis suaedae]|uniref:IS3 family transposase n=1 Tax=Nocardiopsis suaedae TaxID=3018444 RepID=A0ABT4TT36_9ACTN|nr:IS3 family transposase [Nocardiopsis suaedae]MDA2807854.1 IS3 family transposase [Nocardiopsis suaedae]
MAMKVYPPEFKADAVALYRSRPGATIAEVADGPGVNRETLRSWIRIADGRRGPGAAPARQAAACEGEGPEQENRRLRARIAELEKEREILRRAAAYFGGRDEAVSRFCFVEDMRGAYGVKRLCEVLGLSRSGFYAWKAGAAARAARAAADAELTAAIRRIHAQDPANGAPRITAELREQGHPVNHKRIERLMREAGIQGLHLRRKVRTTVADPDAAPAPDLLGRDFTAASPNTRYVGDITYLPVEGGRFCYLATVMDLYSRRLVGWSVAEHMRAELVVDALEAARRERGSLKGAVFHSDRGAQYASAAFAAACRRAGVARSMGAVGSSADNAAAESFNATLKRETLQGRGLKWWSGVRAARLAVFSWIARYNTRRRHSANGQLSPVVYEQRAASLELAA